jgi:hypothetical protein
MKLFTVNAQFTPPSCFSYPDIRLSSFLPLFYTKVTYLAVSFPHILNKLVEDVSKM